MTATKNITDHDVVLMLSGQWAEVNQDVLIQVANAMMSVNADNLPRSLIKCLPVTVGIAGNDVEDETTCNYGENYEAIAHDLTIDSGCSCDGDYCITILWTATNYVGEQLKNGSFERMGEAVLPDGE